MGTYCWMFRVPVFKSNNMSSQADPFRDIVKQNVTLYRDAEESRESHFQTAAKEQAEWTRLHEIYLRAAKCFAVGADVDLKQIGIYDETPLEKLVDKFNAKS